MPHIGNAVTVNFTCWDTVNNVGKTGDASNITLRGSRDGVLFTPYAPSITQIDATNMPGVYSAFLTATENNGQFLTLGGKSSTSGCIIIPTSWTNELSGLLLSPMQASINAIPTTPLLSNDVRLLNLDEKISSRSTLTAAQVWANSTRTLSSFGTLVSDVASAVWGAATRTLTAISDSAGVTTLLSRIASALTITGGKVDVNDKTGFALTTVERAAIATQVESQIINETDSHAVLQAIVAKIAEVNPSLEDLTLAAIASAVRTELTAELARMDAAVSTRLAASGYTAPPTAVQIRQEIDTNSTRLDAAISTRLAASAYEAPDNESIEDIKAKTDNLPASPAAVGSEMTLTSAYDAAKTAATQTSVSSIPTNPLLTNDARLNNLNATISSRLASASYTVPPSASDIRSEIDTNSTKLDVAVGTRLAAASYTAPDNADISSIADVVDKLDTMLEADGDAYRYKEAALSETPASTDAPSVVDIRNEMDANSIIASGVAAIPTNPLLTNDPRLDNLNATIASRLALEDYIEPDNAGIAAIISTELPAIQSAIEALNFSSVTEELQNVTAGLDDIEAALQGANISVYGKIWSYTLTNSATGHPIKDAQVCASTDPGGQNIVQEARTDAFGVARLYLVPGTYYIWRFKPGFNPVNPDVEVVQ
jgi:hypothetical protein